MKAVRYHQYGDENVLHLEDADRPTAAPGQVVVRVAGTTFNPVDAAIRAGYLRETFPLSFPHVPGFDVAGLVVEVDEGVRSWSRRDEVLGFLPMGRGGAAGWEVGDRTGAAEYGTRNDTAVVRPPGGAPIVLAVVSSRDEQDSTYDDALIAEATRVVAGLTSEGHRT